MRLAAGWIVAATAALCSCGDGQSPMLPKSGGRPYEVTVVSTGNGAGARLLCAELSKAASALPQDEPMFDVSPTDSAHFNQTARLARSIVIVSVNADVFTSARIRYEKNVWAKPQMVVYVNAPTDKSLGDDMAKIGKHVANLLARAEMNTAISRLEASNNGKAAETVKRTLGCGIKIPANMKSGKRGNNFVWYSNNAASGMQNICVYSYKADSLTPDKALAARDSVMRANIPGEREGMYMQTAAGTVEYGYAEEDGQRVLVCRGLWEMHGDAMGGPFVSRSIADKANGRVVVAETFVYAPEMRKRNLLRQAEAALYTLTLNPTGRQAASGSRNKE